MKRSSSAAKAKLTPPASAASKKSGGPPTDTVSIATGPNTTGHTDQVSSVHVDEEGFAPADAVSEIGHDDLPEG